MTKPINAKLFNTNQVAINDAIFLSINKLITKRLNSSRTTTAELSIESILKDLSITSRDYFKELVMMPGIPVILLEYEMVGWEVTRSVSKDTSLKLTDIFIFHKKGDPKHVPASKA